MDFNSYTDLLLEAKEKPYDIIKRLDQDNLYISFTQIPKLGINPRSNYDTPIGIYSYPAWVCQQEIENFSFPFAKTNPYVQLFRAKNPQNVAYSSTYTEENLKADYEKFSEIFNITETLDEVISYIGYDYKKTHIQTIWSITRYFSEYKPSKWAVYLRALYDGFVDDKGEGFIHPNEPKQAVFFGYDKVNHIETIYKIVGSNIEFWRDDSKNYYDKFTNIFINTPNHSYIEEFVKKNNIIDVLRAIREKPLHYFRLSDKVKNIIEEKKKEYIESDEHKEKIETVKSKLKIETINGKKVIKGGVYLPKETILTLPNLSDVEVKGNFHCPYTLTSLKGAPRKVDGWFVCEKNPITSLEGAPEEVGGDFKCNHTYITSLKGSPKYIGENFNCSFTKITSLKYSPKQVGGHFICYDTFITSLEGSPKHIIKDFYCSYTPLTSLKGAPEEVGGLFDCSFTEITSLEGAPKKVGGNFDCSNTKITSLKGAPQKINNNFFCSNTKITSLKGAPQKINNNFFCSNTNITSLEGAPQYVGGSFHVTNTPLISLKGIPVNMRHNNIKVPSQFTQKDIIDAQEEEKERLKKEGKLVESYYDITKDVFLESSTFKDFFLALHPS